jgi:hypothetical protein
VLVQFRLTSKLPGAFFRILTELWLFAQFSLLHHYSEATLTDIMGGSEFRLYLVFSEAKIIASEAMDID